MSVVPLSSPLSPSITDVVDHNNEKDSSSVSELLRDYSLLNSIVDTNQFEKSLEIYSLMLNSYLSNSNQISFENILNQFIEQSSQISSNELQELIQIFQNPNFRSFISSYDSILEQHHKSSSNVQFHLPDDEDDNSHSSDQNCIKSEKCPEKLNDDDSSIYASKLIEYNVSRLKIVRLEKREGEPLGATICRLSDNDYRISIARIVHGSISQGLFSIGDQLLEINQIQIQSQYRTLDEIVQLIDSLHGTITFLLLPISDQLIQGEQNQAFQYHQDDHSSIYVRCLFSYDPYDDIYIPCRELGLHFEKDSILEIVNRDDSSWWQAFIMENDQKIPKNAHPGLIPSKQFQEKRLKIVKCLLDDQTTPTNHSSKKRLKNKFRKSLSDKSIRQKIFTRFHFGTYEPVQWFIPNSSHKRPIVLIGPPHIGRHQLRQLLMNSSDLSSMIDVAVPHTTRLKKSDEIDGRDYHFITRNQFEKDIQNNSFVEHGEYEKNLYGTSKSAIETCCINSNKICILNLLPQGLDALKYSNLIPFVIYIKPPSNIQLLKQLFNLNEQQLNEIEENTSTIELNYSYLFDQIIQFDRSIDQLFQQLQILVKDVQIKPMWVNQSWFSPRERF